MAFWGIEVKPEKPYIHHFDVDNGRLHISQATLGNGSSTKKSILQCKAGEKDPIYLCSLLPDKNESVALNLEFEEENEVIFSVQGSHSIHLSGFFVGDSEDEIRDAMRDAYESDSFGEEISGTESDDSSDYDSEKGFEDLLNDDDDDDMDMYQTLPVPNSGVTIEEIEDDDKPATDKGSSKHGKKNKQLTSSANNNLQKQVVVKGSNGDQILESEDEDGFPILPNDKIKGDASSGKEKTSEVRDKKSDEESKKKKATDEDSVRSLKRKLDTLVENKEEKREGGQQNGTTPDTVVSESDAKQNEKKKKKKTNNKKESLQLGEEGHQKHPTEKSVDMGVNSTGEGKKKKKKNAKRGIEAEVIADKPVVDKKGATPEKTKGKPTQVRTFPNGLIIEEVAMGKPDGKKASPGKQVGVRYIGKLQKNGKIFDSNIGGPPFKFRLGIGQVIKGWDVGVNGMRVGDKRRLTIPPKMGYGAAGAGSQIPSNATLVFDVELLSVK